MNNDEGFKDDDGKLDWTLLPWISLEFAVKVMMFGAKKYAPDSWMKVEDGEARYKKAAVRHIAEIIKGEWLDKESGIPHAAHCICDLLFIISLHNSTVAEGLIELAVDDRAFSVRETVPEEPLPTQGVIFVKTLHGACSHKLCKHNVLGGVCAAPPSDRSCNYATKELSRFGGVCYLSECPFHDREEPLCNASNKVMTDEEFALKKLC